jgi:pSer/pThr/pTyr-binding forkhead associated (FHA) protein
MSGQPKESFFEACGLNGPLELVVNQPGEAGRGRRCLFDQPFLLVGRDRRADLRLEETPVGRRHAYLQVIAGQLFCVDLDSRTGTHWEDGPRSSGWLAPGRVVRIGPFEIHRVRAGGRDGEGTAVGPAPDWSPTETRLPGPPAGPRAIVVFSRRGRTEARCRLTRVLTLIGRSSACRLRLSSPEVSRHHCALLRTPSGVWAIDLQGRGGIRVGGKPVPWARLADGDRLEVGNFVLRLRIVSTLRPASAGVSAALPQSLAPLAQAAALDPGVISPVFQQMATMQQQMFDQFQQAMLTMVQMFGALHRDQMGLVREELDRLRDLTQELYGLRADLVGRQSAASLHPAPAANGASVGVGQMPHQAGAQGPVAAGGSPPRPGEGAGTGNGAAAANPTPPTDGNIHAWLSQRIAAMEEERQTRWQKLMNAMLGK